MEKVKFSNNGLQVLKEIEDSKVVTRNGKEIKIGEIKCPLCGENMYVSGWSLPSIEEEFSLPYYDEDISKGHMSLSSVMCEVFTWTCPHCHSELKSQVRRSSWEDTMIFNLIP